MAHELQKHDDMGSLLETPWHGKGNVFDKEANTEEMLVHTGLNWNVIERQALVLPSDGDVWENCPLENYKVLLREDILLPLGVVSNKYVPLQNQEIFSAFNDLVEGGVLRYETGGSLRNCRSVWVLCRYMDAVDIAEGDKVDRYLLITTTHDGTGSVELRPTFVRVVCNNTLQLALNHSVGLKFQHTGSVSDRVAQATAAVALAGDRAQNAVELFRRMAEFRLSEEMFEDYVEDVIPDVLQPEFHKRAQASVEETRQIIRENRFAPENASIAGYRADTLWAAYNAVTRHTTHNISKRVKDKVQYTFNGAAGQLSRKALGVAGKLIGAE